MIKTGITMRSGASLPWKQASELARGATRERTGTGTGADLRRIRGAMYSVLYVCMLCDARRKIHGDDDAEEPKAAGARQGSKMRCDARR